MSVSLQKDPEQQEEDMLGSLRREVARLREGEPDMVLHCSQGEQVLTHR